MTDKLNGKEKMELVIESSLQLLPYVGGALATAYFGTKSEKRFKRIESFYADIAAKIEEHGEKYASLSSKLDEDEIINLIENLNEKVEQEHRQEKIEYLKNYFLSAISDKKTKSFDESLFFLDTLASMTITECDALKIVYQATQLNKAVQVGSMNSTVVDQYAIVGAIGRLKNYGYVRAQTVSIQIGGNVDNALSEAILLTPFGKRFINYCLL